MTYDNLPHHMTHENDCKNIYPTINKKIRSRHIRTRYVHAVVLAVEYPAYIQTTLTVATFFHRVESLINRVSKGSNLENN